MTPRSRGPALFWRVAIGNAAVLAVACVITAFVFAPSETDIALREFAIFLGGLASMLAINLLLLRRALGPLRELTSFARRIDPLEPGLRLQVTGGDSEATELADAFNDMLDRLEAERRASVGRALAAQEGERLRVAQELHDGVGQSLTGVVLQLGRVVRDVDEGARPRVVEAQETARESLEEVRRIARRLRPEALDDLGLASALHVLGERVAEHTELRVDVHVQPSLEFGADEELVLYRVAQEALTNVARHAGAKRAEVRLERAAGRSRLEVDDDGSGVPGEAQEGGGVLGMRERAVLVGGTLKVARSPLGGTRVTLELPS
ncbi:HAMP domain-containing sensor histidine kinase [Solirubrobacter phytolaccae]|uniref:histidine kinase n=1 Tax=Solirubrobacter phytolaccae TaxID=1404360 RepID=A0A9X3N3Q1_9ACTN|nr:HAMP domain-containing sensor histidine kinase [Solirubrobacter phytolaccae]MDA0179128.1 HAMP domain-containing sensor histidine kinase [Solirubrobacter phytolaccae]